MKSTLYLIMLLTAGLLLAACAKDEAPVNDVVDLKFSAILAAKEPAAKSVDAEGNTTWEVGEKIAIYYQKTDDSFDMAEARVDAVDGGAALVSAHLSDAKDHSGVKFVYPYSLANSTGDLLTERFLTQHGTMADISDHFDATTGTGTLVIDGSSCSTDGPVHLYNQAFIGKFTPQSGGSPIDGITLLTITAGTRTYTVTPSEGTFGTSGIYVAMLPVSSQKVALTVHTASRHYHYAGVTASFEAGKLYKSLSVPMTESKVIDLGEVTGNTTAGYGDILTGTLGGNYKISVADGATVTLQDVNISCLTEGSEYAGLSCLGDATLLLKGTNTIVGGLAKEYAYGIWPGIHVAVDHTLTILGTDSDRLTAHPGTSPSGAGIGGGDELSCGNIVIKGGNIVATGGSGGAGIGTGMSDTQSVTCGIITITGGNVTASGGSYAAGIGSGENIGYERTNTCGAITITGGNVTATGGNLAAGIGCGVAQNSGRSICGPIRILGGTVVASGGNYGAGIGNGQGTTASGSLCMCESITFANTVTSVTARKGKNAKNVLGEGYEGFVCPSIKLGNVQIFNGTAWSPDPMVSGTYGGLSLAITDDTWTLTPSAL